MTVRKLFISWNFSLILVLFLSDIVHSCFYWRKHTMIAFVSDIWRSASDNSCCCLWSCASDTKHSHGNPHKQVACYNRYEYTDRCYSHYPSAFVSWDIAGEIFTYMSSSMLMWDKIVCHLRDIAVVGSLSFSLFCFFLHQFGCILSVLLQNQGGWFFYRISVGWYDLVKNVITLLFVCCRDVF